MIPICITLYASFLDNLITFSYFQILDFPSQTTEVLRKTYPLGHRLQSLGRAGQEMAGWKSWLSAPGCPGGPYFRFIQI